MLQSVRKIGVYTILVLCLGFTIGVIVGKMGAMPLLTTSTAPKKAPNLMVRLHEVTIRPDHLKEYGQWQDFLHTRHNDAVKTLEREHMFVEAMFRSPDDPHTLYWLEVRDDQGAQVESSTDDLDVQHQRYMDEVLQPGTWSLMATDNILIAPFIERAIDQHRNFGRMAR